MKTAICVMLFVLLSLWSIPPALALTEKASGTPTPETPQETRESAPEKKLDINTASMQELLLIPGLGDEQVLAIMNGRPYETLEELLDIPGIDEPLLETMRDLITVTPQTEDDKININTASLQELLTLPGLGKKRAQAIIDGRPYETVEDLLKIPGIDAKRLAKIRDMITVAPGKEEPEEQEEDRKKAEEKQREEEKREEERQREEEKREEERQREEEKQ